MSTKSFKSRLLSSGSARSVFVIVAAVAGIMSVQSAASPAFASPHPMVNGQFAFSQLDFTDGVDGVSYVTSTMSIADSTAVNFHDVLPPAPLDTIVPHVVTGVKKFWNSDPIAHPDPTRPNDFRGLFTPGSLASVLVSTLPVGPDDAPIGVPNITFLQWATTPTPPIPVVPNTPTGTVPNDRFSYIMTGIVWSTDNPTDLGFISEGYVHDSTGFYADTLANLTYTIVAGDPFCTGECWGNAIAGTLQTFPFGNDQHIPEPVGLSILGVGLLGLGLARRRS